MNGSSLCVHSSLFFYLFVDLEKLLHSYLLVLGNPEGPVDTPKAASSTIFIEKQILMLYLYKRRARGRHCILTHGHSNAFMYTHNTGGGKREREVQPQSTVVDQSQIKTKRESAAKKIPRQV